MRVTHRRVFTATGNSPIPTLPHISLVLRYILLSQPRQRKKRQRHTHQRLAKVTQNDKELSRYEQVRPNMWNKRYISRYIYRGRERFAA